MIGNDATCVKCGAVNKVVEIASRSAPLILKPDDSWSTGFGRAAGTIVAVLWILGEVIAISRIQELNIAPQLLEGEIGHHVGGIAIAAIAWLIGWCLLGAIDDIRANRKTLEEIAKRLSS
ncbi:MAG: hypothetical protein JWN70_6573 [Planctomycetaceae bacterium]|nr:hypothetical protein [Planctomycetaceae bacterium]